ncbi:RSP_2647 family RNA methyltransferase [Litoreibacter roseus]|uniref:SAM-dependent methyltransferase n=1 Tax=Litoreibacter roseus TaxID=2601869 RepID=A0A6N6JBF8_9RHOB|nr:class I SAM-dependent rRNA methyltransferase [Litoreibacter roseus]GFE63591.1 SAM-dependent methyltransferase [Litoreibacter roseus]
MSDAAYPVVRLKPKIDTRALKQGAPWVYADELVTDRRTKALSAGSLAVLQDTNRSNLGLVTVNMGSKIIARTLDQDVDAAIDPQWFAARISSALALRERLYSAPFYRLIHAEADGLPGVIVDRFGDVLVVQPNAAWADVRIDMLADTLLAVTGASTIVKNASGRARALEGLDTETKVIRGAHPGVVEVPMNGAIYMADLAEGQKTGLFYDQRDNHAFAQRLADGARVLDVFSHVGGFGLAALAGGATHALAVDGSAPALDLATRGAEASGWADRFATRKGDAFKVMEALQEEGQTFDLVIADPPAFAPSKKALQNGLTAYSRVAMNAAKLVAAGGYLVLCSCSHAADLAKFRQASLRGIARAGRTAQVIHTGAAGPDHPVHPALAESSYLKALFFRLS